MEVKTTNALMKYLRNKHNINIGGSKDKLNLVNMGYYHGYKGYRYIKNPSNKINFYKYYSNEEKNGDVLIKKVDLNNLINDKKIDAMKIDVHLMSLSREEEFLKTLKELQKILS